MAYPPAVVPDCESENMRPKFVVALLLTAALIAGAAFLLKRPAAAPPPVALAAPVETNVAPSSSTPSVPAIVPVPAPVTVAATETPEQREAFINAEKDRLSEWQMNNDPQSLSNILADLMSPEKEIRLAAIEAAKQFDSTNAIPVLKATAAITADNDDAIAMLQAAEFLAIPDITFGPKTEQPPQTPEQLQANATARAHAQARRDAAMQRNHPQSPGSGPTAPSAPNQ